MDWKQAMSTFATGTNTVLKDVTAVRTQYRNLSSVISSSTLGLIKLPSISSKLNSVFNLAANTSSVLESLNLSDTDKDPCSGNHSQKAMTDAETGSFKWVEMETTPEVFATADSVLLFAGNPVYANNAIGTDMVPIGLCQGFSFNTGVNVQAFHELRCEQHLVIPGKSMPGQINITRLCGKYSSLVNRLHIKSGWNMSAQSANYKPLFGMCAMFMSPRRENTISVLYFERCAITSASMGIQASGFQVAENVGITFGRVLGVGELDNIGTSTATVSALQDELTSSSTTSTSSATTSSDLASSLNLGLQTTTVEGSINNTPTYGVLQGSGYVIDEANAIKVGG